MSITDTQPELIAFAQFLVKSLKQHQPDRPWSEKTSTRLRQSIDETTRVHLTSQLARRSLTLGADLWDTVHASTTIKQGSRLSCQCLAFAALLVDAGLRNLQRVGDTEICGQQASAEVADTLGKTARLCLAQGHLSLSESLTERAAAYHGDIGANYDYLLTRVMLAWRQDRLDIAVHWLTRLHEHHPTPEQLKELANVQLAIGADCRRAQNYSEALIWLDKSESTKKKCTDLASDRAFEVKLVSELLHSRIGIREDIDPSENEGAIEDGKGIDSEVKSLVARLEATCLAGQNVYWMKLTILDPREHTIELFLEEFNAIMHHIDLQKPENIDRILHAIGTWRKRSPDAAIAALEALLTNKKFPWQDKDIMGNVMIAFIHFVTSSLAMSGHKRLRTVLDLLSTTLTCPEITTNHTSACHLVIWSFLNSTNSAGDALGISWWCFCALKPIFSGSGPENEMRFKGRLVASLCDAIKADHQCAEELLPIIEWLCSVDVIVDVDHLAVLAIEVFNLGTEYWERYEDQKCHMWQTFAKTLAGKLAEPGALLARMEQSSSQLTQDWDKYEQTVLQE